MPYPSQVGKNIQDLPTPCLIVSAKAVEDNCSKMLEKAQKLGVQLRGQTKTHKTIEAGVLQTGGTKRYAVHTVRNLHFLSKNSTLISRENCRFFLGEKLVKMLWFCTF